MEIGKAYLWKHTQVRERISVLSERRDSFSWLGVEPECPKAWEVIGEISEA